MTCVRSRAATMLVIAMAVINILGNLLGATLTFVFFGILEPRLNHGVDQTFHSIWDRALVFGVVICCTFAIIAPINFRWVRALYRKVRDCLDVGSAAEVSTKDAARLHTLGGAILRLPVKLACTTLAGWTIAAILISALPHIAPGLFPWSHLTSHKISSWLLLVGAPVTICWVYFVQERWLQYKIPRWLPADTLLHVPVTYRINVLPKLLAALLLVSILPVALVSHITLHQISEVQAGRQSIANFLGGLPTMIVLLLATSAALASGLSFVVAKSVSEPLKRVGQAMDEVRSGNLDVRVPVVSNDEIGEMSEGFNRMIREHQEVDAITDTFGRYVSREVVEEILKSPGGMDLKGELRDITILVADLRDFTPIAESLEPARVLLLINRFLQRMTDIIIKHQGTIDEFTGDGILVFFGAPRMVEGHSARAVACALEMQQAMTVLNLENSRLGFPELHMGIGINRGELIIGNIGSEKRKKYGAVGTAINVAFRIEDQTRGGEILVSPSVRDKLDGMMPFEERVQANLKGFDKPLTLYGPCGTAGASGSG
jgi:adenylate cyclase